MTNFDANAYMNNLSPAIQEQIRGCKSAEEIQSILTKHLPSGTELSMDELEGVTGGKGIAPVAMAAVMLFSSLSPLAVCAADENSVSYVDTTDDSDSASVDASALQTGAAVETLAGASSGTEEFTKILIDTSLAALGEFVPGGKTAAAFLGDIFGLLKNKEPGTTLEGISDNINELRDDMDQKYKALKDNMDENTKKICDELGNKIIIGQSGETLNDLSGSTDIIVRQINNTLDSEEKKEEVKYIDIAMQIGSYHEWSKNDNLIYKVAAVGNVLCGKNFSELNSRDLYTVAYSDACSNVMFSGEAYDAAGTYVDSVMYQYLSSYATALQCLAAYKTVAEFTPEQIENLPPEAKANYEALEATSENLNQVTSEIDVLARQALDMDEVNSVISHYAVFKYKQAHDRNVFVNKGTANIVISPEIKDNYVTFSQKSKDRIYYHTDYADRCDAIKEDFKNSINEMVGTSAIQPEDIAKLADYVEEHSGSDNFSEKFADYLSSMGIDTSNLDCTSLPRSTYKDKGSILQKGEDDPSNSADYYGGFDAVSDKELKLVFNLHSHGYSTQPDGPYDLSYLVSLYYAYELHGRNNHVQTFQTGTRLTVPTTATEVLAEN